MNMVVENFLVMQFSATIMHVEILLRFKINYKLDWLYCAVWAFEPNCLRSIINWIDFIVLFELLNQTDTVIPSTMLGHFGSTPLGCDAVCWFCSNGVVDETSDCVTPQPSHHRFWGWCQFPSTCKASSLNIRSLNLLERSSRPGLVNQREDCCKIIFTENFISSFCSWSYSGLV
jgi:hypothetical protein